MGSVKLITEKQERHRCFRTDGDESVRVADPVDATHASVKVISGVLVRLTTCKRLTNSLPKLSLTTLFPPETAGYQVGGIYGRACQYPSGFISWGYRRVFFKFDMGKV